MRQRNDVTSRTPGWTLLVYLGGSGKLVDIVMENNFLILN